MHRHTYALTDSRHRYCFRSGFKTPHKRNESAAMPFAVYSMP